jgi:hypothetical protein
MAHSHRLVAGLGIATLMSVLGTSKLHAAPHPDPSLDAVSLTAWLWVDDGQIGDVQVEVEVNGKIERGRPEDNGRVELMLPADVVAVVRFIKPGHLTKEVTVDTHHVNDGKFHGKQRHLKFAVVMQALKGLNGQTYPGPVGTLSFDEGGGRLSVSHDKRLVPAPQQPQFSTF